MKTFKIILAITVAIVFMICGAEQSWAQPNSNEKTDPGNRDFTMSAKQVIEVKAYSADTRVYEIVNLEFYGQGPLMVTPEELARCVKAIDLKKIKKFPLAVVGNQYQTEDVMKVLALESVAKRKKKQ